ncbi:MAG: HAD family hydrolase, partial [Myxococcota bacterium]
MLFLDLDGTLLRDERRHYAAYASVLETPEMRGVPIPSKEYWALRRKGEPWEGLLRRSRLLPMKFGGFREAFEAKREAPELLSLDTLAEGAKTFLGKLYTKTPIVLVTQRWDGGALEAQLEGLGVRSFFAETLHGAPRPERRPSPDRRGRHKAALVRARYRLLPNDAVYLGDTETDVQAARILGFAAWLVEGGHRDKARQVNPIRVGFD